MRQLLKVYLSALARSAIKKHHMEMVIVVGWHGTEIVRELIYEILSDKFQVRRNTKNIWWDLSVPLTILGYKDERRNFFEWMVLIFKATVYLIIGPKSPHKIVLNLVTSHEDTARFWSEFINPNFLIIVNQKEMDPLTDLLIKNTVKNNGRIIFDSDTIDLNLSKDVLFAFGKSKDAILKVVAQDNSIIFKHGNSKIKLSHEVVPPFSSKLFASVLSLAVLEKLSLNDAAYSGARFDFHTRLIPKIMKTL
jgi:hypothetical protein